MSALVFGAGRQRSRSRLTTPAFINTSFPGFTALMNGVGPG